MPKLLFSKVKIYKLKDLVRKKHPKTLDVLLSRKKQKNNNRCVLIQKKTDPDYQPQDHMTSGLKLADLLEKKDFLAAFRSFLESEFSAENIDFWLACREYKMTLPGKRSKKAAEIYKEFLHPTAQKEVNIDYQTREKIKKSLVKPELTCFDEAETQIYRLMEKDSCPRFLKTEAYQNLRNTGRNPK